jgi:DNA ligase-1
MNSARSAHEISGLPHCLVDGFKHRMSDIPYEERCYILTHYHSDHYGGLASYWKHARIYCSETTANLITNVLQVNPNIVTRIRIGDSITIKGARVVFMTQTTVPAL